MAATGDWPQSVWSTVVSSPLDDLSEIIFVFGFVFDTRETGNSNVLGQLGQSGQAGHFVTPVILLNLLCIIFLFA